MRRSISSWILCAVLLALAGASPLAAQTTGATLQGTLTDEQGAVLPGVTVTIVNTETGWTRVVLSDARGTYRAAALPPGLYEMKVEMSGFNTQVRSGMTLTIGQEATIDLTLKLSTVQETVTVTGEAPIVETTKSTMGTTVTKGQLDTLPIAARDFTSLASLTPGVTSVGGGGLNAGGQLSRNNSMLIDGASNNEVALKSQRGGFSLEAVREYVVMTSQFSAEYGNASGAVVSVVTRSGTNQFQGRAFLQTRNDALTAQDYFSKKQGSGKAPFSQQRYGGFGGGPLVPDRLHYFGSYEGRRSRQTSIITSPLVPVNEREVPYKVDQNQVFVRVDGQFNSKHSITARYRLDNNLSKANGIGGFNSRELGYDLLNRNQDFGVNLTSVLSNRGLNELRVIYSPTRRWYDVTGYAASLDAPLISRPSGSFGKSSNQPQGDLQWYMQVLNNFSYTIGSHNLKAGVSVNVIRDDAYFLGNKDGTFSFSTDAPFDPNNKATYPYRYTRNVGDWLDKERDEIFAGFVQDSWRLRNNLTLNLGVRYDVETAWSKANFMQIADATTGFAPERGMVPDDRNNLSPRLGFAWDPLNDGKTAVRGGYGLYYDQTFLNITGNIAVAAKSVGVTINNPGYPDPYAGGTITPTKPSTTTAAPDIQVPRTQTFSIGMKRELFHAFAVSADYVNTRGTQLFRAHDVNYPDQVTRIRPNPNYLRVTRYETNGNSWSNALLVAIDGRTTRGSYGVSYTLSKGERDVEDFGFTAQDQNNPGAEKALGSNDRRHQVVANASWRLPLGIQLSGLLSARTGRPYTITVGKDVNGDSNSNDRPDLAKPGGSPTEPGTYSVPVGRVGNLPRNSATGPNFVQVDMHVSKVVKIGSKRFEGFLDAFNLTNRANFGLPVGNLSSSSFGTSTGTSGDARQLEIGFRFDF